MCCFVEAGGPDKKPEIHDPRGFVALMGSEVDWKYQTEPEPGLNGRRIACNRGKTLGGTSATNAMIFIRGHRFDFDHWNYLGNEGWSYDDVLPYFRRSEDNCRGANRFRGAGGPVTVSDYTTPSPVAKAFVRAGVELGFRGGPDWDFNVDCPDESVGHYQFSITRDGRRCSTAVAYLNPILDRPNLTVQTDAHVSRLLIENGRCVGIEYRHAGQTEQVRCEREVIVSAGAFDSPKLLMLSGIGPADTLRRQGITVQTHLPGVGQNLQDHLLMPQIYGCREPQPVPDLLAEAGLLTRTRPGTTAAAPDLQINFNATIPQLVPPDCPTLDASCTFISILVRPQSVGEVVLRSDDSTAPPVIRMNYLQSRGRRASAACRDQAVPRTRRHPRIREVDHAGSPARPGQNPVRACRVHPQPRVDDLASGRHVQDGLRPDGGRRSPVTGARHQRAARCRRFDHADDRQCQSRTPRSS